MTNIYNNARMRTGLLLQQPTGTWTNGYTWDAAHRPSTETSPAGTFTYNYIEGEGVSPGYSSIADCRLLTGGANRLTKMIAAALTRRRFLILVTPVEA